MPTCVAVLAQNIPYVNWYIIYKILKFELATWVLRSNWFHFQLKQETGRIVRYLNKHAHTIYMGFKANMLTKYNMCALYWGAEESEKSKCVFILSYIHTAELDLFQLDPGLSFQLTTLGRRISRAFDQFLKAWFFVIYSTTATIKL